MINLDPPGGLGCLVASPGRLSPAWCAFPDLVVPVSSASPCIPDLSGLPRPPSAWVPPRPVSSCLPGVLVPGGCLSGLLVPGGCLSGLPGIPAPGLGCLSGLPGILGIPDRPPPCLPDRCPRAWVAWVASVPGGCLSWTVAPPDVWSINSAIAKRKERRSFFLAARPEPGPVPVADRELGQVWVHGHEAIRVLELWPTQCL
jgi:hypothetical protein